MGLLSYAQDPQVEAVRLIYKTDQGRGEVSFQLLRQDAQTLKKRVGALLAGQSDHPLRLEREPLPDGGCFTRLQ